MTKADKTMTLNWMHKLFQHDGISLQQLLIPLCSLPCSSPTTIINEDNIHWCAATTNKRYWLIAKVQCSGMLVGKEEGFSLGFYPYRETLVWSSLSVLWDSGQQYRQWFIVIKGVLNYSTIIPKRNCYEASHTKQHIHLPALHFELSWWLSCPRFYLFRD